jgi:hypothetical protein
MTNLAPPATQTYRVGPHGQSQEVRHGAIGPPQAMLPGPPQAPVLASPPQALGLGAVAPPTAANQPPQQGGGATVTGAPLGTSPQDYSEINSALNRLSHQMTDADMARNLRWQREVNGETAKIDVWKVEAASLPGLQFYAYMQPGDPFLVVGHSLFIIYSTATIVASFHGKMVLFTGDRKSTWDCVPVFLPQKTAFEWNKPIGPTARKSVQGCLLYHL